MTQGLKLLPFVSPAGLWGFIDTQGHWVIHPDYEAATYFSEGLALIKKNGRLGFVTPQGVIQLDPCFIDSFGFWQGLAPVAVPDASRPAQLAWGLIDQQGRFALPATFDFVGPLFEGKARVQRDGRWAYVDSQGETILETDYDWAGDFNEGVARVQRIQQTLETFYIDHQGQRIGQQIFDNGEDFAAGRAAVYKNGLWGFIDIRGELVIPPRYREVGAFAHGQAPVTLDGKSWHYIDAAGQAIGSGFFTRAEPFHEAYARVQVQDHWGFIDPKGAWLLPPSFAALEDFQDGWAMYRAASSFGYINAQGVRLQPEKPSS